MSNVTPCGQPQNIGLFYSDSPAQQRKAAGMCFDCPAMLTCGRDGENEAYGVWGGTTPEDRPEAVERERKRLEDEERAHIAKSVRDFESACVNPELTGQQVAEMFGVNRRTVVRKRTALAAIAA